ncbi:sugar nucleotide-binding protein [Corynebacterium aquatimens]|uniref:dTDP-4-dehydrorhamnose reductase n=1 Tax=Corynebacterium aquatimens TaxID=1190508 RepID=A0A931E0J9_9CORY|nr:bifunctional dTDP-4-dehydrorhamnose 3,5-epimerase family protein/NAD(P)-dependent oxidoreductase [Corynebacterium aquatimens]MBG6122494.1 dTDP-4-dehydrorhamnose 3,5-epimerase [Corynebacterium aquatimens]WJY64966.1 putative dTDP-4-dehydrorhamnose 3,5-epimerase [Corynebacterium aquatimens]
MTDSGISGLIVRPLNVHGDNRGWFKENWAGEPPMRVAQNNVSFNASRGATRGMHAEPWDKYVSVATGRVWGAWVDLREGSPTFGATFGCEIGPDTAVFVPRGVANGFQALEDNTTYIYLCSSRWSPDAQYSFSSYTEIDWPLEPTEVSDKDKGHPLLIDATPVPPRKVLVTGANGQLGRALQSLPGTEHWDFAGREELDVTGSVDKLRASRDWGQYSAIINAAAYNDVNGAETGEGRAGAWAVNAVAPGKLAAIANEFGLTLVHVSTDFVFDGSVEVHPESEVPSPLSVYGASKSAGEAAAMVAAQHFIVRTSWVFGDGANFVATMARLARGGVDPAVVRDQRGRPTWADDLAKGIVHLMDTGAAYGIYNLSSGGDVVGRDELTMAVFAGVGEDPARVQPVTTEEWARISAANGTHEADRPKESTLALDKIEATGFTPTNWRVALALYLADL